MDFAFYLRYKWKAVYVAICFCVIYFVGYLALDDVRKNSFMSKIVITNNSSDRMKVVCTWNSVFGDVHFGISEGSRSFQKNCAVKNCYMIHYRNSRHLTKCDAVLFHLPLLKYYGLPKIRSEHQRYVLVTMESPQTDPLFQEFKYFFNWTMTYRLDSDIVYQYFSFLDLKSDRMVSPFHDTKWMDVVVDNDTLAIRRDTILKTKRKSVIWFVSDCAAANDRIEKARELQKYINVDIFGKCGDLSCSKDNWDSCLEMMRKEYYFLLSFENSHCVDYVTEKLVKGFLHNVVPIYYGSANISFFAPPHSYIDATRISTKDLAKNLQYLINNPVEYLKYFWWQDYYRPAQIQNLKYQPMCKLCKMLNDPHRPEKTYESMHDWWEMHDGLPACQVFKKNRQT